MIIFVKQMFLFQIFSSSAAISLSLSRKRPTEEDGRYRFTQRMEKA